MITSIANKKEKLIEIDLTGPDGNVFSLISRAMDLCKTLNKRRGAEYLDAKAIVEEMKSKDYDYAVEVFEHYFGEYVILYQE